MKVLPLGKFTNTFQKMHNEEITLEGINLHQEVRLIFENVNLSIKHGDFVYLVGETGSGKSSLPFKGLRAKIFIGGVHKIPICVRDVLKDCFQHLREKATTNKKACFCCCLKCSRQFRMCWRH